MSRPFRCLLVAGSLLALPVVADTGQVVALRPATLAELATAVDIPSSGPHLHRHQLVQESVAAHDAVSVVSTATQPVGTAAPPVTAGFFSASRQLFYPADAAGAVAPQYVVGVFNSGVVVQDRNGRILASLSLAQFWSDPSVTSGDYYDCRIIYDSIANRFVIAGLYDNHSTNSTLLIAATAGGDPTGTWSRYRIATSTSGQNLSDFTRLGMTSDRFVITANGNFGSDVWVATKNQLYSTLTSPVHSTFGASDLMPVTFVDASTDSAYLMDDDTSGLLRLFRLDNNTTISSVKSFQSTGWEYPYPSEIAPQPFGSNRMDVGDTTIGAADGRNGTIWVVHTVVTLDQPRRSAIRWWRINLAAVTATTGLIDDPTGAAFYAFPSVAINRAGGVLIGYSLFSSLRYPTAAYSYVSPAGVITAPGTFKEGDGSPLVTRWGDYTTTVVDPINDLDFWSVQSYGTNTLWSTWWGQVRVAGRARAVRR